MAALNNEVSVCSRYPGCPGCTGPMRYGRIISLSSCETMWQCQYELAGRVELCPNAGDLAWIGGNRVFEAGLPGFRRPRTPLSWTGCTGSPVFGSSTRRFPVHHFKDHLVDVHGVGIGGEVVELPNLSVAHCGFSVIGSAHILCTALPIPSTLPSIAAAGASEYIDIISISAKGRVTDSAGSGVMAGSTRNCGGVVGSSATAGPNVELHYLAG